MWTSSTERSPAAEAAMSRSPWPSACGPAIRRMSGRRSLVLRCARGLTPARSPMPPRCLSARNWVRQCPRHCSRPPHTRTSNGACRSHRGNVLWFNQNALREAGVAVPGPGYTTEAFSSDLAKVVASGKTALCLGGKDRFTATELFENTLLGVVGRDGWAKIRDDSFDWTGPQLKNALTRLGDVVSRADPSA